MVESADLARPLDDLFWGDRPLINVYGDESCHLPHDDSRYFVLGAVWCPAERAPAIAEALRALKRNHGLSGPGRPFEMKWTKVSAGRRAFYEEVVRYFFWEKDLHFRAVVADKAVLDHAAFHQTHDDWYYRMYWVMLRAILTTTARHRVYLDIKDTRSQHKTLELQAMLRASLHDFYGKVLERVQTVRAREVEQVQLADLLAGAVGYAHRGLTGNAGKLGVVALLERYCGPCLTRYNSLLGERKVNIFHWKGKTPPAPPAEGPRHA